MGVDEICMVAQRSGMVVWWDGAVLSVGKRKDPPPETPAPPVEAPVPVVTEKPASIPPPEPRPRRETASDRMRRMQAGRR